MISLSTSSSSSSPSPSQLTFPQRLPYTSNVLSAVHTFISTVHQCCVHYDLKSCPHTPVQHCCYGPSMWAASISAQMQHDRASFHCCSSHLLPPAQASLMLQVSPQNPAQHCHRCVRSTRIPTTPGPKVDHSETHLTSFRGLSCQPCSPPGLGSPFFQASLPWLPISVHTNYSHICLCPWPLLSGGPSWGSW